LCTDDLLNLDGGTAPRDAVSTAGADLHNSGVGLVGELLLGI
jgi:hypothetical protein